MRLSKFPRVFFNKQKPSFLETLFKGPQQASITYEESLKILSIEKEHFNLEILKKRAFTLYTNNSPDKGGSVYVQAKVINAYNKLISKATDRVRS